MIGRLLLLGSGALLALPGAGLAKAGDPIPGSYICTFLPGPISTGTEARSSVAAVGGRVTHVYNHVLNGFSARMSATAVQKLVAKNPLIKGCTQDRVATIPPTTIEAIATRGGPPTGGGGATQTVPWGVKRVGGGVNYTGGTRVAWVIDTGIDLDHPDLNVSPASLSLIGGSGDDDNGHGTHVAGIIAARSDNNAGVVGVAAGATVVGVKVLDSTGNGEDSGVIAGINHVVANGSPGDVINLSLITSAMPEMDKAVADAAVAGFFIAIAAGNNSADAGNYSPAGVNDPAGLSERRIYTVSAIDSKDVYSRYSNWGNPPIDFAEPGSSILSTYKNGSYATLSGTSMAAPHLAGILLLHGGGTPNIGGKALRDPDGTPDPIGVK